MKLEALDDLAEINPRPPKSVFADARFRCTFLPMSELHEDGRITPKEAKPVSEVTSGYTYFEVGDVLLAKITPCMQNGKAAHVKEMPHRIGFGSTEFHVIRCGERLDPGYLFFQIWNPRFRHVAEGQMTGTAGQRRVPTDFLKRFRFPLPDLPEQRRIAALLDRAGAVRDAHAEAADIADRLQRRLSADIFRDLAARAS